MDKGEGGQKRPKMGGRPLYKPPHRVLMEPKQQKIVGCRVVPFASFSILKADFLKTAQGSFMEI